jgi:hypothetical protein
MRPAALAKTRFLVSLHQAQSLHPLEDAVEPHIEWE